MLTNSVSLTAPLESEVHRVKARHRRRDAAAPYLKRPKEDEDDKDIEFYGQETSPATHSRRGSGFLARLASYIPIVNKLVAEEDKEEVQQTIDSSPDIQTTQEDLDEEEEANLEAEEEQEGQKIIDERIQQTFKPQPINQKESIPEDEEMLSLMSSVTRTAPLFVTPKEHLATPPRPSSKRCYRKSRSSSRDSSVDRSERSPALMHQSRKRGDKRVFLPGPSQHSKVLRITNSQNRQKSTSPSPHDSALDVLKQKKTITLEEFERLQKQLHDMVETTPQTQLAMTQAALANGLEHPLTRGFPSPTSFPGYVPGSIARYNRDAMIVHDERKQLLELASKSGLPFGKRPRNHENRPIVFSSSTLRGQLTREERLMRKPRPSRLLTGAKRDVAARNAYSAAIAQKILSTLNKVQNPLELESQKPTPSTSLSWAKHHLSRLDDGKPTLKNELPSKGNDIAPPTSTLPRIAFPQSAQKSPAMKMSVKSVTKPLERTSALVSPPTDPMTSALSVHKRVSKQPKSKKIGNFEFTLPQYVDGTTQINVNDEDTRVQFTFSPPPSLCEPPVKCPIQKTTKAKGCAVPFNLVPSSPKSKTKEWVSKPPTTKQSEIPNDTVDKPVAASKENDKFGLKAPAPAASMDGAVNPLAKFMQLKPGQWKCPGCSVLNEAVSTKCPCCETADPGGDNALKVAASTAQKASTSTSRSGFSFGKAVADCKNDTVKPSDGLITASGFSFGALAAESKKETDKPAGSISSSGFSFSPSEDGAKKNFEKPSSKTTTSEFSFTAPTAVFDSNEPVLSTAKIETWSGSAPTSFKFSAPARKADEASADIPLKTGKTATAPSFSFGISPASVPAVAHVPTNASAGSSFDAITADTNKGKRKAFEVEEPEKDIDSSLNIGTTSIKAIEVPKSTESTLSFKAAPKVTNAILEDSERPKKRLLPNSVDSDSKSEASISAFSFNSASKPPQVPVKEATGAAPSAPSLPLGETSILTSSETPEEVSASPFTFGGTSSTEKITEAKPVNTAPPESACTFKSLSSTSPTSGFGQPKSKAPAFSFGAPPASSKGVTSVPAASTGFTFGQSAATSGAPAFASASSTPAFGLGTLTPPSIAASNPSVPSAPAFTFGSSSSAQSGATASFGSSSSSQSAASSSFGSSGSAFGQKPELSGFGSSSNTFESSGGSNTGGFSNSSTSGPTSAFALPTPAVPAFSFGASSQTPASSAPAAGQPAFTFGTSSAPSGLGAAPVAHSGFGSSAGGGFNSASGVFRSSSPAPAFGNQAPPTVSAFNNSLPPPTNTFGGPPFGSSAASGFGSGPLSSGFRTPSPTFAFGNASGTSAFGGAPAFGAPASVPAFGAAPASVPAFGAAPASVPAFGAAPASVPAFGAAPVAGAFGGPCTDGGFNMGAAPQHAKGRRILKAKTRSRRTS